MRLKQLTAMMKKGAHLSGRTKKCFARISSHFNENAVLPVGWWIWDVNVRIRRIAGTLQKKCAFAFLKYSKQHVLKHVRFAEDNQNWKVCSASNISMT